MPVEAYANDYANPDIKPPDAPDSGAAMCLAQLHDMIGLQLESTKHQPTSCVNTFLGVDCDTSHVQDKEPYVEFRPSEGRIARILGLLAQCAKFGMSSHAAGLTLGAGRDRMAVLPNVCVIRYISAARGFWGCTTHQKMVRKECSHQKMVRNGAKGVFAPKDGAK